METLKKLYADYLEEAYNVRKKASVFAGLFGLGDDPKKNPCHETFYENACQWVAELLAAGPAEGQAAEVARFMLEEPKQYEGKEGFWFLYVCIGLIRELVPYLSKDECAQLAKRMNELYPRRDRMPVQQEVFKMLQKAGK